MRLIDLAIPNERRPLTEKGTRRVARGLTRVLGFLLLPPPLPNRDLHRFVEFLRGEVGLGPLEVAVVPSHEAQRDPGHSSLGADGRAKGQRAAAGGARQSPPRPLPETRAWEDPTL